ncbi:MAG: phosphoenolpyruvate synthase regulatory protein, partial [Pseudomonadota bacterium]
MPSDASERSAGTPPAATYFHVHLLSDSTGETLNTMLKASASQFAAATPFEHI